MFEHDGKLTFNEFCNCTRRLGFSGNIKKLWQDLDGREVGYISLKDIHPAAAAMLEEWHALILDKFGNTLNSGVTFCRKSCLQVEKFH